MNCEEMNKKTKEDKDNKDGGMAETENTKAEKGTIKPTRS